MKYGVNAMAGGEVSLEAQNSTVILDTEYYQFEFTLDQFKDLRKAVGYVWQEVHSDGSD